MRLYVTSSDPWIFIHLTLRISLFHFSEIRHKTPPRLTWRFNGIYLCQLKPKTCIGNRATKYYTDHYPSWTRCVAGWLAQNHSSLCGRHQPGRRRHEKVIYRAEIKQKWTRWVWWRGDSRQGRFLSPKGKKKTQPAGISAPSCLWCKFSLESMNQREVDISPKETLLRLRKTKVHLKENLVSQQWEQKLSPLGRYKTILTWCNSKKLQGPWTH